MQKSRQLPASSRELWPKNSHADTLEPVPYTSWNAINGEPNGRTNNNYAWVYTKVNERRDSNLQAGSWNDVNGLFADFICVYEPVPRKLFCWTIILS